MVLYGAGGHAKVVHHSLSSNGVEIHGVFDDDKNIETFLELPVSQYSPTKFTDSELIVCIGCNKTRNVVVKKTTHPFGTSIDPSAFFVNKNTLGAGSVVLAKAIVQSHADIGHHVIINSGAVIEHDCKVSDLVHVGPGAVICGNVRMGFGAFIGANATILPGISIGDWAVVGAGAVVTKDVAPNATVAGNPAKTI